MFGAKSAELAISAGAARIELNRPGSYHSGGLTPDVAELVAASAGRWPVRVMIRPRGPPEVGTDFLYSDEEFQAMRGIIIAFKNSGMMKPERGDGFVFGILELKSGSVVPTGLEIDVDRNTELVRLAAPFKCVFHRAFDEIVPMNGEDVVSGRQSWERGLETVITCGFDGLLTSGGPGRAAMHDNMEMLRKIVLAAQNRIEIIIGGGVRSDNVLYLLLRVTDLVPPNPRVCFHSSCFVGDSSEISAAEVKQIVEELQISKLHDH